jgi:glycosyltransferase involved in cell wall biosynthesis
LSLSIFEHFPDIELHIICSAEKTIDIPNLYSFNHLNIHFHYLGIPRSLRIKHELQVAWQIRRLVSDIKPDLVHAHFTTGIFPTILFRKMSIPYWGTFHGLGLNSSSGWKKRLFYFLENHCFQKLDKIILLNQPDVKIVQTVYKNKVYKHQSLGLGCNLEKFNPTNFSENTRATLRQTLGIQQQKVIAFTGRFVAFKGFHIVVKTFLQLNQSYPQQFKLLLIGGLDPVHSSGLSTSQWTYIEQHPDITITGFTSKVEDYLSISDYFVFPSKKEGIPVCVLEALAMGIPVIASDSRGNNEVIEHWHNGVLIPSSPDYEEEIVRIIQSIELLEKNPQLYQALKSQALASRSTYSRENFINDSIAVYKNSFCESSKFQFH